MYKAGICIEMEIHPISFIVLAVTGLK